MLPDMKLGVVVLTNQESGAAFDAIAWHVLDHYLGAADTDWLPNGRAELNELARQCFVPGLVMVDDDATSPKRRIALRRELPEAALLSAQLDWVKSHVVLAEGKVYCAFESPLAGCGMA